MSAELSSGPFWALTAGVFVLAGAVKGLLGLGLPTLSMALLALWMPPAQAAALLVLPSLVTNLWQAGPWREALALLRRTIGLQVGMAAGTLGGLAVWGSPSGRTGVLLLGLALIAYAAWGLAGRAPTLTPAQARWTGPAAGLSTGALTALTGVFVMPVVPYLQSLGLPRAALMRAMGLSFSTCTLALGLGLAGDSDGVPAASWWSSLALLVPAWLGMALGQRLQARLPLPAFRRCFFAGLALLGGWMVLRAAV
jgi:uncharacterized membrane protein YfcA